MKTRIQGETFVLQLTISEAGTKAAVLEFRSARNMGKPQARICALDMKQLQELADVTAEAVQWRRLDAPPSSGSADGKD